MKEVNDEIETKLEPWNLDVSYVHKMPQAGTITIAASSEEEARKIITEMFPGDSELNIIQVYRVADCPQMKDILAEKNTPSKKELN